MIPCKAEISKLPPEVFAMLFCYLELQDILVLEMSCRQLQRLTCVRKLWLRFMHSLDPSIIPELPPYLDINNLSTSDIRKLVVDATRIHFHRLRGTSRYRLRSSVVLNELKHIPNKQATSPNHALTRSQHTRFLAKLSPGKRYLFIKRSLNLLQVVDLHNDENVVWSYQLQSQSEFLDCSIEMSDDKVQFVTILFKTSCENYLQLEVHQLKELALGLGVLEATLLYSKLLAPHWTELRCSTGNHIVLSPTSTWSFKLLLIIDWKEELYMEIEEECNSEIAELWIFKGILFLELHQGIGGYTNHTISAVQLGSIQSPETRSGSGYQNNHLDTDIIINEPVSESEANTSTYMNSSREYGTASLRNRTRTLESLIGRYDKRFRLHYTHRTTRIVSYAKYIVQTCPRDCANTGTSHARNAGRGQELDETVRFTFLLADDNAEGKGGNGKENAFRVQEVVYNIPQERFSLSAKRPSFCDSSTRVPTSTSTCSSSSQDISSFIDYEREHATSRGYGTGIPSIAVSSDFNYLHTNIPKFRQSRNKRTTDNDKLRSIVLSGSSNHNQCDLLLKAPALDTHIPTHTPARNLTHRRSARIHARNKHKVLDLATSSLNLPQIYQIGVSNTHPDVFDRGSSDDGDEEKQIHVSSGLRKTTRSFRVRDQARDPHPQLYQHPHIYISSLCPEFLSYYKDKTDWGHIVITQEHYSGSLVVCSPLGLGAGDMKVDIWYPY